MLLASQAVWNKEALQPQTIAAAISSSRMRTFVLLSVIVIFMGFQMCSLG